MSQFKASVSPLYLLLLTLQPRFHPPRAQEAAAERLHFNPAHHGTDGEQIRQSFEFWIVVEHGCRPHLYLLRTPAYWMGESVPRRMSSTLLHARLREVLISCNQTLVNQGLPPAKDAVSSELTYP